MLKYKIPQIVTLTRDGRQFTVPCPAMVATHIAQASQNENL